MGSTAKERKSWGVMAALLLPSEDVDGMRNEHFTFARKCDAVMRCGIKSTNRLSCWTSLGYRFSFDD